MLSREFVRFNSRCYFLHEWKENDYAFSVWKRKTDKKNIEKNIESIKRQIHNLIWQIQEVKCTKDSGWE